MWSPISAVISSMMSGSWWVTRSKTASLMRGGRFAHSVGCWRTMTPSTISGTFGSMIVTMCSAIAGGSSCS